MNYIRGIAGATWFNGLSAGLILSPIVPKLRRNKPLLMRARSNASVVQVGLSQPFLDVMRQFL